MASVIMMEDAVENARRSLYHFALIQPTNPGEEVIFYFAKIKLILEEYILAMRLLEKEPYATLRYFQTIKEHMLEYIRKYGN